MEQRTPKPHFFLYSSISLCVANLPRVCFVISLKQTCFMLHKQQTSKSRIWDEIPLHFGKNKSVCNSAELYNFLIFFPSSNLLSTPKPKTSGLGITNHGYGSGGAEV